MGELPVGRRRQTRFTGFHPVRAWLFEKLIREENGFEVIDAKTLNEILVRELDKKLENVKTIIPEIAGMFLKFPRYVYYLDVPSLFIYKDIIVLPSPHEDGLIYIVSKEKEKVEDLLRKFEHRINEISEIVSDFGLNIKGIYHGNSYVEYVLKKTAVVLKKGEFKRELEREVYESLSENITTAILHNLTLGFGYTKKSKPFETFEYDIISCLSRDLKLQIEVKDYSTAKNEAKMEDGKLKSKLILEPLDKARLIDAECIIILEGFEDRLFKEYEMFGRARGVTICTKENCLERIRGLIIENLLKRGYLSIV